MTCATVCSSRGTARFNGERPRRTTRTEEGSMARDERQDVGKLVKVKRIAGSDLPKRGEGMRDERKREEPKRWPGYTGRHRGERG